ncbi:DivIVA domain-containing protein [Bifidobacterium subtile]|jgi:DivIVA domain-containing protein|uniref:DivIVA domain-containing protein n=1 Tax=Bifidobacterium subtile TaxID=77635 RepID=UPI0023533CF2|nr:DivIVA domain-containing protein [Bifidobacterium tibiigranuli]MCI1797434.1 DivIVA domain-containing protein [Bifidobacterium tibiigranuli]
MLTSNEVKEQRFATSRFMHEGYDADQVDDFLDEVASTIATMHVANIMLARENQQLKESRGE